MIDPDDYQPEPLRQWHVRSVVDEFRRAVEAQSLAPVLSVPAIIGGREVSTGNLESVDPGNYERVVAIASSVGRDAADDVIAGLAEAQSSWSDRSHEDRAEVLIRAAAWMRDRRDTLAALEVFEAGKPWDEADADVCEAIDFCEYYARQAVLLGRGGVVQSPPGEDNRLEYFGRGVTAVIGPWNFPLAIPTGLTAAALVAGNAVALKPAEQTPAIAYQLVEAFRAAGLPEGVLAFVPGPGEEIGAALVAHPGVQTIAFTGSKDVGLTIIEEAGRTRPGQAFVKRVIAEMGGKNAMIIDSDADLDQAVPAVAQSAFGFAGQKCSAASRVFVMEEIYDEFIDRLIAHSATLEVGHPSVPSVVVGPVIDADAYARLTSAVAGTAGNVRFGEADQTNQPAGWYVPPAIVDGLPPADRLMIDE
ncbi:MAG: aldehyde dehydrogenase family protein, partial [Acidimicrobiia bacterium]|nr:aldehyde dehydrogenase family protein [Acidimicrobiia bacterium]